MPPTTPTAAGADPTPWHALSVSEAIDQLGVDPAVGLDSSEVAHRRERFGPNVLDEPPKRPAWLKLLDQFRNFLIIILILAAVVAVAVSGDLKTPIVILIVVVLNAVLGFVQENRAERSLDALRTMLVVRARVMRGGSLVEVDTSELVPGDIVIVEAGDRVPADGRLLEANSLEAVESALTGESAAVVKVAEVEVAEAAPIGDRQNLLYMNTVITRGRGRYVVTSTGMGTEMGRIAGMLSSATDEPTPLQKQLDHVAHMLAGLAAVIVAIVFAVGLLRGQSFESLFLTAVALAVASVPEGLPAVLAVTLAIGAHRMARRQAIVKRLASVETLGCTSVICSDKTGTLTLNQMTARQLLVGGHRWRVTGEGTEGRLEPDSSDSATGAVDVGAVMKGFVLCNEAVLRDGEVIGDPTEVALVVMAAKAGVDLDEVRRAHPRRWELPFDSATKFMATLHDHATGRRRLYVKGAFDVLVDRCTTWLDDEGRESPLDDTARTQLAGRNHELATAGMRVLALATRDLAPEEPPPDGPDGVGDLHLVALVGIVDPARPEAADAIASCHQAGIAVKMITGDHASTARAIAADLGITGEVVTGVELDAMDDAELTDRVDDIGVFARVAPEHKLRLVRVLQARDEVVAMTGDGVNDAPALRQADIGVAMGITGTEVSKEAATMVLADDNFATIVDAVRRGRTIYDNIVKFVSFQLSTTIGFAATFLVATAVSIASGKPFNALQILWVNIIMDGPPAMALGVDPHDEGTMRRPPRPVSERILKPSRVGRLVWMGLIMAAGTLGVLVTAPDYLPTGPVGGTVAGTMAFTTFVLFQFFNLINCRSEQHTAFRRASLSNGKLWASLAGVVILQVGAVHLGPLQSLFDTTSLTPTQWAICVGVASSILWLEELRKLAATVLGSRSAAAPRASEARQMSSSQTGARSSRYSLTL
jgi:Ca2+-transporting ATPase